MTKNVRERTVACFPSGWGRLAPAMRLAAKLLPRRAKGGRRHGAATVGSRFLGVGTGILPDGLREASANGHAGGCHSRSPGAGSCRRAVDPPAPPSTAGPDPAATPAGVRGD